ncbi:MAG: ABC transporter substrate-binding protein [Wenzhouxiangellaceae bacterium]|nr:ABC transporter substrate-binding protein [Wenzhouxiangellaceae bacterium]
MMLRFLYMPVLALCMSVATIPVAQAQSAGDPVEIVRTTTSRLFEIVNANRDEYQQNRAKLQHEIRDVLLPLIDEIYSARLILGRSGRGIEQEKIAEFADALSDLLIGQYAEGLLQFQSRDQVEVLPLTGENTERMTRVKTRITMDNGQIAPVDYVFRKTDDGWQIFDVIVEGISYVATFRNQVGEQIRQQGFDETLAKLQKGEIDVEVKIDEQ